MLNLDFTLETIEERKRYLNTYIFPKSHLTERELEICSDYLLWGKYPDNSSPVSRKEVTVKKRHAPKEKTRILSFEALIESPHFCESSFAKNGITYQYRKPKFSRSRALELAPEIFTPLFHDLDVTELTIALYDFQNGKRAKPPRPTLIERFADEELTHIGNNARTLTPAQYTQLKRNLIEKRRQQYTLLDSFVTTHIRRNQEKIAPTPTPPQTPTLPFGAPNQTPDIFRPYNQIYPQTYSEDQVRQFTKLRWQEHTPPYFDLRDPATISILIKNYTADTNLAEPYAALIYYITQAKLTTIQKYVLAQKLKQKTNAEIAKTTNKKFGTHYRDNYISTIYHKSIVPAIANAALYHQKLIENLPFEENFRQCTVCGDHLLLSEDNFCRRSRSSNGFSARCKVCEKKIRDSKGGKNQ